MEEIERLGDVYSLKFNFRKALECYRESNSTHKLVRAAFNAQDYETLISLIDKFTQQEQLKELAECLENLNLIVYASKALEKSGEVKRALDLLIINNYWDSAVELAERNQLPQINSLIVRFSEQLNKKNKKLELVELYRKTGRNTQAAAVLNELALDLAQKHVGPLVIKQIFVLAALEINLYNKKLMNPNLTNITLTNATKTLDTLITADF